MTYTIINFLTIRVKSQIFLLSFAYLLLLGCSPSTYSTRHQPVAPPALPSTQIYFYPEQGQNQAQQTRDRYECYIWAVRQSGFDPNQSHHLAPHQRIVVKSVPPPGTSAISGAVTGAMLGSVISPHHRTGEGLVFGAIAGALLGAASDVARQQKVNRVQQQYDAKNTNNYARLEKQARDYKRAMGACLEGRGYSVQ